MKYLKLYEELNQQSNLKNRIRLNQLGLMTESLTVLSVSINWELADDFANARNKDTWRPTSPIFIVHYYYDWPASTEHEITQVNIDQVWSDWREWLGQEGDSDEIFDHLIEEAQAGRYDLLHLRNEGQFYDPYTKELIGTGSMQNPKLNESADTQKLASSVEEAAEKLSKWKRLDRLGLAERFPIVQIETQSKSTDPDLGFPAYIDSAKFREFKEFVKTFGVVHTNSYAGRSSKNQTVSAHLWEMPQWSMWAFSKLPELAKSEFAPIRSYDSFSHSRVFNMAWQSWYEAAVEHENLNEAQDFHKMLKLFKLGLMDADQFDIHKVSIVAYCPLTEPKSVRAKVLPKIRAMYEELKPKAAELGVQFVDFEEYRMNASETPNQTQFYCIGPMESIQIVVSEIKKAFNRILPKTSDFRSVIAGADDDSASHYKLGKSTGVFREYVEWLTNQSI